MNAIVITPLTLFVIVAGALLVALPYLVRTWPAVPPDTRLGRFERRLAQLRHWLAVKFRYPELGGYVHDTSMTQYIPPTLGVGATATWTPGAGQVADTIAVSCDATDESATFTIPIMLPSNSASQKGAYLRSIEVDYEVRTAALDACSALVNLVTRGANGADATVAAQDFDYDTGHDAANERITLDEHAMTLTLDTPIWIDNGQYVLVEMTFDKAATSLVDVLGAFANYTLRL